MTTPEITVVIPCFNGASFLSETLGCVLAQTLRPREILVIDDGSTDESGSIAESFGSPVRVIRQENQGESCARNRGIEEASGQWIALLDADDCWKPAKLEKQWQNVSDDVVAVHTKVFRFGAAEGFLRGCELEPAQRYSLENIAATSPLHPSSLLLRADVCPRFDTREQYGEDTIFQLDLIRRGKVVLVDEPLTGYRVHCRNQTSTTEMIETRRVEALERWLNRNEPALPPDVVVRMRDSMVWRLAGDVLNEKQNRRWHNYEMLRNRLATQFPGHPAAQTVLGERTYPRFLYRMRDAVSKWAGTALVRSNG